MPRDSTRLPLAELRRRYLDGDEAPSPQLVGRLRRDPRRGARALYRLLRRRQERAREEQLRLDALLNFERVLWRSGLTRVAGVDEVGIGPLAGPVVAAAVVFPPGVAIAGIDDSKRLDPGRREELAAEIRERAAGIGVGLAEVEEIDRVNVYQAGLAAMRRAVEALPEPPEHVLVDAREIPGLAMPQNPFDKGDGLDFSIAAASIVAKTHRDRLMEDLDRRYPEYGFARHKGYGTADHQEAIRRHGPCPEHRASYPVLRELCGEYSPRFYRLRARLDAVAAAADLARFEEELAAEWDALGDEERRKLRLTASRRWQGMA
jgi:ribonuclease HII